MATEGKRAKAMAFVAATGVGSLLGLPSCASAARLEPNVATAPAPQSEHAARRTQFCRSTVTSHDIDGCVNEVTPAQASRREHSYLLHFENDRLMKVEEKNGSGRLTDDTGFCGTELFTYEGTRLARTSCLDEHGRIKSGLRYERDGVRVYWLDEAGRADPNDAGAAGLLREFDEHGWVIGYRYIDLAGAPVGGANGVFHVRRKRGPTGALIEDSFWDAEERPVLGKEGAHVVRYALDGDTETESVKYYGRDGKPTLSRFGHHERRYRRDDIGNILEVRSYGIDGQPVITTDEGAAGWRIGRDAHGNEIRRTYIGVDNRPMICRYGYVTRTIDYDAFGRKIRWSHFDAQDRPLERREGHSIMEVSYDGHDDVEGESFFDAKGRPVTTRSGYAHISYEHDGNGDVTLERHFDTAGKPPAGRTAAIRREYGRPHQVKSTTYLGGDGQPTEGRVGYARVDTLRDWKHRAVGTEYFDAEGKRVDVFSFRYIVVQYAGAKGVSARVTRTEAEAKARAEEALRRLRAGADFTTIQEVYCDDSYEYGPLWAEGGAVHATAQHLRAELLVPLAVLPEGKLSEVIASSDGFWILKRAR
jgi:hypothetical protein